MDRDVKKGTRNRSIRSRSYQEKGIYFAGNSLNSPIAAWQTYNIEGNRWEVLSYLWRGEINTLDKLSEQLNYRGISRDEYDQILQELVERGWIEENAGAYQLTGEGKRIREEAEAMTDHYFFAPWSCLNESELNDLSNLATQLSDRLHRSKEKPKRGMENAHDERNCQLSRKTYRKY